MHVLIVEDEARIADFIQRGLRSEGWIVTVVPDAESGLDLIDKDSFDVIVLDLMLPGMSGQDMCRQMRARQDLTPVLMLSALGLLDDRVSGLRLGADDYLLKPFEFDDLVARLEALARRKNAFEYSTDETRVLVVEPFRRDTNSFEISCDEECIDVTTKERGKLLMFLTIPRKVFSRERILNAVWGNNAGPLTNAVDVCVGRLRKRLVPAGNMIESVRGAVCRLTNRS